ncbi:MAG: FecR family protein, partial [Pseudomonadota bacterium]
MRSVLVFSILLVLGPHVGHAEVVSCDCPQLTFDSCLEEEGVKFYSEKCGPAGARIRSCAKPTCVPKDPLPKGCDLYLFRPQVAKAMGRKVASAASQSQAKNATMRKLAAFQKEMRGLKVGSIHTVMGPSYLILPDGKKMRVTKNLEVHEKDTVETSLRGHVKILFDDGNVANIKPNSKLKLDHYEMGDSKKAILNLIKGKVRSKVRQKYKGTKSSQFQVRTKSAVAGVRGTDFVVEHSEDQRIITRVSTFEGSVALRGNSTDEAEIAEIPAGHQASFIVVSNDQSEVFSDDEISDFVARGYM